MYPNQIGFAKFGELEIECLEIFDESGRFDSYQFRIAQTYYSYTELCRILRNQHPTIAKLLNALGREKFLGAVLEWNPADQATKDSFYLYLAKVANQSGKWDDQPW